MTPADLDALAALLTVIEQGIPYECNGEGTKAVLQRMAKADTARREIVNAAPDLLRLARRGLEAETLERDGYILAMRLLQSDIVRDDAEQAAMDGFIERNTDTKGQGVAAPPAAGGEMCQSCRHLWDLNGQRACEAWAITNDVAAVVIPVPVVGCGAFAPRREEA